VSIVAKLPAVDVDLLSLETFGVNETIPGLVVTAFDIAIALEGHCHLPWGQVNGGGVHA